MPPLRDHLLRTMAAVPPESRVLVLSGGLSDPAEPLARLGFEVRRSLAAEVAAQPDAHFDWVVAVLERTDLELLREVRRVLKPGGWIYTASPRAEEEVRACMEAARLAMAQPAQRAEASGQSLVQTIYRRVEASTPV